MVASNDAPSRLRPRFSPPTIVEVLPISMLIITTLMADLYQYLQPNTQITQDIGSQAPQVSVVHPTTLEV